MKRLVLCAMLALAAAAIPTPLAAPAAAQGWFSRDRSDDDGYSDRRMRRDSVSRRDMDRRAASSDDRQRGGGLNFFQRLFGVGRAQQENDDDGGWRARQDPGAVEVRPKPRRPRRVAPAVAATPSATPGVAAVAPGDPAAASIVPTAPTTFVAVIGDSIADNLAGGLQEGFADTPELQIKRFTKPNSGLVRADYFDFVPAVQKAIESGPITYAVFEVGVNDRQPFTDARKEAPLSDEWRARYAARIDAVLAPLKERKIPIYWVGLAASESRRATEDHVAINALAKERVEAAGGTYVDVWEGFVDEDGDYAEVGPQLDGQTGRLRMPDGVHFSKAGARKLAHYVEQEIRKVFQPKPATPEAIAAAVNADPGTSILQPGPTAERPKPVSSPIMVLTAQRRAEDGGLAAAPMAIPARDASESAARVLVKGEAPTADPGRMDDHRWPGAEQPKTAGAMLDKATPVSASPVVIAPPPSVTDPRPSAQTAAPLTTTPPK